ncbi:MAG: hypothetical protein K0R82_992 [Flavipsychrobacter sp.]|jgi:hypothetical protein|nr:hypothetical protein [Flavipsychrobacter sp.]
MNEFIQKGQQPIVFIDIKITNEFKYVQLLLVTFVSKSDTYGRRKKTHHRVGYPILPS